MQVRTVLIFLSILLTQGHPLLAQQAANNEKKSSDEKHEHSNALVNETSPYLLMHAHNPVNWYGWNEESLALAKSENKPIFLSIGYSSCHWCHVMERESFMDEEIAKFLNENFICVKVDREERPDVDEIYMTSLRVVNPNVNGGWPLSMFLTPNAAPFFGGTYYPARSGDRGPRSIGFMKIASTINNAWNRDSENIKKNADLAAQRVQKILAGQQIPADATIDKSWIDKGLEKLMAGFDPEFGGFGFSPQNSKRPKFPEPSNLLFLIDEVKSNSANTEAKKQLITTCERMMMGGILDHLGGGFHRYSVDRFWRIPHFEKMLYDNAQLATVYSEIYQMTGREEFRQTVDELLEYVLREMKDKGGAFYSALDAESEGEEGKFYRWDKSEIQELLTPEEFKLFAQVYGIDTAPNFEGKFYVPQLKTGFDAIASRLNKKPAELMEQLKPIRKKLLDARSKRPRPITDTKILASWNGMMIRGFADAGRILKNEKYIEAAALAAKFVINQMKGEDGRLYRTYTDGQAKLNAYLPDYADVIDGLIALHETTKDKSWLDEALKLQQIQDDLFWDEAQGGYFYTSKDHESLLARSKQANDGPVPSGNSVSTGNLLYFAKQLDDNTYSDKARKTALGATVLLRQFPSAATRLLIHARKINEVK